MIVRVQLKGGLEGNNNKKVSYPVIIGNENELRSFFKRDRGVGACTSAVGDCANSRVALIPCWVCISCKRENKIQGRFQLNCNQAMIPYRRTL
jgi:hypothetical protein